MATWQQDARRAALAHGLDPNVFIRQMGQEAHGEDLTSPAGAQGPAQFMPGTARSVGLNSTTVHQRVPSYNAAAKLMAGYVKQYGSYRNALVAYNAGPGRVGQALPAETQNYIKTILGGSNPKGLASPQPQAGNTTVAAPASSGSDQEAAPTLGDPGRAADVTSLLESLLSRPVQTPQSVPVAPPSFATSPVLPNGAQIALPEAQPAGPDAGGVEDALSLLGSLRGSDPTPGAPVAGEADSVGQEPVAVTVRNQRQAAKAMGFPASAAYPLAKAGKLIGFPHAGTHTLGNWQSDNAVDIGVKAGTPMLALQDGVVVKVTKHPQGAGRFAGDQITIRGKNGNEYFYGHGVAEVKAGQRIRRGEVLGVTGSANGVEHLHFGQMRGDPRQHTQIT